ncbi:hypothetical protein PSDI105340_02335 [Pseudoalteromonas distincta]
MYTFKLTNCELELSKLMAKLTDKKHHTTINSELNLKLNDYKKHLGDIGFNALSDIDSSIYFNKNDAFLRVYNPTDFELKISANIQFLDTKGNVIAKQKISNVLKPGTHNLDLTKVQGAKSLKVEQKLQWQSLSYQSHFHESLTPFNGVGMKYKYTKNNEKTGVFSVTLTGPYSGKTDGTLTLSAISDLKPLVIKELKQKVKIEPYESRTYHFELANNSEFTRANITAYLDVDGEKIRLVKNVNLTK